MLRIAHQGVRARLLRELNAAGFRLSDAQMNMVRYPPPDGVRPIELAVQMGFSKQAVNYLIAQMEAAGYFERRTVPGKGRVVVLTPAGRHLTETTQALMRRMEAEFEREIGRERYGGFRETLRAIAGMVAPHALADEPPSTSAESRTRRSSRSR